MLLDTVPALRIAGLTPDGGAQAVLIHYEELERDWP